jgi:predicted RNA binding protein YcfA (HicA-like mRNA interferase family)
MSKLEEVKMKVKEIEVILCNNGFEKTNKFIQERYK